MLLGRYSVKKSINPSFLETLGENRCGFQTQLVGSKLADVKRPSPRNFDVSLWVTSAVEAGAWIYVIAMAVPFKHTTSD